MAPSDSGPAATSSESVASRGDGVAGPSRSSMPRTSVSCCNARSNATRSCRTSFMPGNIAVTDRTSDTAVFRRSGVRRQPRIRPPFRMREAEALLKRGATAERDLFGRISQRFTPPVLQAGNIGHAAVSCVG